MENIEKTAVMFIYPDGYIDKIEVNDKMFHMLYFIELSKKSERFKRYFEEFNIDLDSGKDIANLLTYGIDYELTKKGVIAFHNIDIHEIQTDSNFHKYNPPSYFISMPVVLTPPQKEIMSQIDEQIDLSYSFFGVPGAHELEDITYEDSKNMFSKTKTK